MAETGRGKKFVVVHAYTKKKGSKTIRVAKHERSTPRTSKGSKK
ncbi:MAG TPA: hypothetical protein VMD53_14375 [Rhizomicrobium sp.]|nr:hypothetical protein [Rhizomicrobium sp.]